MNKSKIDNITFAKLMWGLSGIKMFERSGNSINGAVAAIRGACYGLENSSENFVDAIKEGLKEMSPGWEHINSKSYEYTRGYAESIHAYWWFEKDRAFWSLELPEWWSNNESNEGDK